MVRAWAATAVLVVLGGCSASADGGPVMAGDQPGVVESPVTDWGGSAPHRRSPKAAVGVAIAAADLDADGHVDVVLATAQTLKLLRGHGDGSFDEARDATAGGSIVAVRTGDLDGDGLPELVLAWPWCVARAT